MIDGRNEIRSETVSHEDGVERERLYADETEALLGRQLEEGTKRRAAVQAGIRQQEQGQLRWARSAYCSASVRCGAWSRGRRCGDDSIAERNNPASRVQGCVSRRRMISGGYPLFSPPWRSLRAKSVFDQELTYKREVDVRRADITIRRVADPGDLAIAHAA